jgi:hypothetical protein
MPRLKLLRWKAIVPLALVLVLLGVAWYLFLDKIVERRVELTGAELVGKGRLCFGDCRWPIPTGR